MKTQGKIRQCRLRRRTVACKEEVFWRTCLVSVNASRCPVHPMHLKCKFLRRPCGIWAPHPSTKFLRSLLPVARGGLLELLASSRRLFSALATSEVLRCSREKCFLALLFADRSSTLLLWDHPARSGSA